jgi:hypothetical protein
VARTPPLQSRRSPDHGWKNGNGAGVRATFLRGGGISGCVAKNLRGMLEDVKSHFPVQFR